MDTIAQVIHECETYDASKQAQQVKPLCGEKNGCSEEISQIFLFSNLVSFILKTSKKACEQASKRSEREQQQHSILSPHNQITTYGRP